MGNDSDIAPFHVECVLTDDDDPEAPAKIPKTKILGKKSKKRRACSLR